MKPTAEEWLFVVEALREERAAVLERMRSLEAELEATRVERAAALVACEQAREERDDALALVEALERERSGA